MEPSAIGSLFSVLAIIAGIVVAAHPETRFSRIFSMAMGPVARFGELRSKYLLRIALVSAFWFVILVAVFWMAYFVATHNGIYLGSDGSGFLAFFVLGCFIAMALLGTVGSFIWSFAMRLFNRDGRYFDADTDEHDVT